jgi:ribosomal protein L37AE/L43A
VASDKERLLAIAKKRLQEAELAQCLDGANPSSRPSSKQLEFLKDVKTKHIFMRAGNQSGKSSVMIRNLVWRFTETHPYWKRRTVKECPECGSAETEIVNSQINAAKCQSCGHEWKGWDGDQLVFLAVIQNSNHIQDMWENRFKPLLPPGSYATKHDSGSLKYVTHKPTGNRIYFFSHDNPDVRKRVQSFSAHGVWIDEMPSDVKLFEELMRRCDAKDSQFFATFTPKVVNIAIKDFVENADPSISKQYRLSKFDNPIYEGRFDEERAKISQLSEADQNTILYGDWQAIENKRLNLNPKLTIMQTLPPWYSPDCDHVEAVDPASSGKVGYCLFVKDPTDTDTWVLIKADHIAGAAPTTLVKEAIPAARGNVKIVKYVADPHENWFIKESYESAKIQYESPFNKSQRRKELLIKGEEALISPTFKIYAPGCKKLIDELNSAEEDPNNPGDIKKASRYHCIDAWVYGLDLLPKYERPPAPLSVGAARWAAWLEQEQSGMNSSTTRRTSWNSRQRWLRR